ncbi:MAG: transglycosylase SLT domain-containing protein [Caldilineaceae bacterium]
MRRTRSSPRSCRSTPLWLMLAGGFVLLGIFLVALTLTVLAGALRLISAPAQSPTSAAVLLVAPDLASLAPPAARPASGALQQMITSPLPTPTTEPTATSSPAQTPPTPAPILPTSAPPITYRALFQQVGDAYGIDWRLLAALAFRESRMDPGAVGSDGDMGLMQILPTTWDEFAPPTVAAQPFDARHNLEVAAAYLLYLQDKLNEIGHGEIYWVLAAYNWGPNNVRRLVNDGGNWDDVPARQRQYVADILEAAFGVRMNE